MTYCTFLKAAQGKLCFSLSKIFTVFLFCCLFVSVELHAHTATGGGVIVEIKDNEAIFAYPNPTGNGIMSFRGQEEQLIENIKITDMLGNELLTQNVNANEVSVDFSFLQAGTYLFHYQVNGVIYTRLLTVE
ncbi:MAG: T9SS type A sorting domain-containing protein [Bacteroidia bacterium]